jgi:CheY-like chemotaxis protein
MRGRPALATGAEMPLECGLPYRHGPDGMPLNNVAPVYPHDVYVLTDKGDKELRGSGTSLSPAEVEILVCVDGKASAVEIAAAVKLLAPGAVMGTLRKLLDLQLIQLRSQRKEDASEITGFFTTKALQPTRKAISEVKNEASSGVTTLQKNGYYVRIARRDASKPAAPEGRTLTVIVVEDEPLLAKFLKQYLSFEGMEARLAANREEILAAFNSPPLPDLVLLDVMLPDADGFDILLKMRQHPVLKSVPVIMLTAKATRESVLKGLAGGADGYITKPFEADALINAVKAVLGRSAPPPGKSGSDAWLKNPR